MKEESVSAPGQSTAVNIPDALDGRSSTDTIDLTNLLKEELTLTERFDPADVSSTSFGKLLNFLPTPALLVDRRHSVVFANEACSQISPDQEEFVGEPLWRIIPRPDHVQTVRSILDRIFDERKTHTAQVILGVDRPKMWGKLKLRTLRMGKRRYLLIVVEDITREKRQLLLHRRHSDELRQAKEELERSVSERTRELIEANDSLRGEIDRRLKMEEDLRESERRLRAVVEDQTELISRFLPNGIITFANEAYCRYFADECGGIVGANFFDTIMEEDVEKARSQRASLTSDNPVTSFSLRVIAPGGEIRWHQRTLRAIFDDSANVVEFQCVATDITDRKRAEDAVARAKEEWERTFDAVPDLLAIIDLDHKIVRVNDAMAHKFGQPKSEMAGKSCYELFGAAGPHIGCPFEAIRHSSSDQTLDTIELTISEDIYAVSVTPLLDEDARSIGCVHVARDITARKRLEAELVQRASKDALTGLFSRSHFLEALDRECASAKRYGTRLTLSILDMDNFKEVNDDYGHQMGDLVLKELGGTILRELRSADFAGRYGGDEFVLAFPNSSAAGAAKSVERIREVLASIVFRAGAKTLRATATAGVAEFDPDRMSVNGLIQRADKALYKAKARGRNRVVAFPIDPE